MSYRTLQTRHADSPERLRVGTTPRSVDLSFCLLPLSTGSFVMVFLPGPTDPFYELMHPPPDETSAQKTARLKRELDAQRVSDSIDEEIKQERANEKRKKDVVNVLLLGQAESGEYPLLWRGLTLKVIYPQENPQLLRVRFSLFQLYFIYLFTFDVQTFACGMPEPNGKRSVMVGVP